MRPGMFDNQTSELRAAYANARAMLGEPPDFPHTSLGSEHFFDTQVVAEVVAGRGLPYLAQHDTTGDLRRKGALLIEFTDLAPLRLIEEQLFHLQRAGFIPVIAHPERYRAVWSEPDIVSRLVDLGSVALLDVAALVGKYGERPQAAALELMELGAYDAACTDSHRPADVDAAQQGMLRMEEMYGPEEVSLLFGENPRHLLAGTRPPRN
jgi:protein-tyrosine phosphatase